MSLLHDVIIAGQPGTHVLAIGVGNYPYLLGGTKELANNPLGLKQLQSPPVSLKAVLGWFLAPVLTPGAAGFINASAPLASIEALASDSKPVTIDTPVGAAVLDAATKEKIQVAFQAWLVRMKGHPGNVGVFYFCGHGIMGPDDYLLAEDFGKNDAQPWVKAFDISTTIRAVECEVHGAVFYFIDACREIARDVIMTHGAKPHALLMYDYNKKDVSKHMTMIYATGEGEKAFAPKGGKVSRYTTALLNAMSVSSSNGAATSKVYGIDIFNHITHQLDRVETEREASIKQKIDSKLRGSPVPLLQFAEEQNSNMTLISKDRRDLGILGFLNGLPAFKLKISQLEKKNLRLLFSGRNKVQKPFVFYHWRQFHAALHWVDFYFLRVLQELQNRYMFDAQALVTEKDFPLDPINKIVSTLLKKPPIPYSKALEYENEYRDHTMKYVDRDAAIQIWTLPQIDTRAWVQFMPYYTHCNKRPGYLQIVWNKLYKDEHDLAHTYDRAKEIVAHLLTEDIKIDGAFAKKRVPPLYVEPKPFPSVLAWLSAVPSPTLQQLEDLLKYFDALDRLQPVDTTDVGANIDSLSKLQNDWINLLNIKGNQGLCEAVCQLAVIFDRWDRQYFKTK